MISLWISLLAILWVQIYCYHGLLLFSYCYFRASTGFFCFRTGFLLFQTGFHGLRDQEMDLVSHTLFHWDMEARRSPFETKGSPSWTKRSPWKPGLNNRRTIEACDNNGTGNNDNSSRTTEAILYLSSQVSDNAYNTPSKNQNLPTRLDKDQWKSYTSLGRCTNVISKDKHAR